jgi:hypothetical protein
MTGQPYEAPALTEIGTVHELTLLFNKVGPNADAFSNIVPLVGSLDIL